MDDKPNCYACKHRGTIPGDCHSCCRHPDGIGDEDSFAAFMRTAGGLLGGNEGAKKLNITAHAHGVRAGWFFWPSNFDPTWLLTCDGFEDKTPPAEIP